MRLTENAAAVDDLTFISAQGPAVNDATPLGLSPHPGPGRRKAAPTFQGRVPSVPCPLHPKHTPRWARSA